MERIDSVAVIAASRLMLTVIRGKQFENAGQCAAFLGLIPKQQESGVFRGRSTLSKKGNSFLFCCAQKSNEIFTANSFVNYLLWYLRDVICGNIAISYLGNASNLAIQPLSG
jgi:hypothetical protein